MLGRWNGPVAATTRCASITPSEVSTRKPGRPFRPCHLQHLHAAANRRGDLLCEGDEIVRHGFLVGKVVRADAAIHVAEIEIGKAVMPGGTVRHQ